MWHLDVVLFAVEFIGDVVAYHSVLNHVLSCAGLNGLCLRGGCTFNLVSQNCTTKNAQDCGCCFTAAAANLIANSATGNGSHRGASTALIGLNGHLFLRTNLAWHGHLLNDLCRRNDFTNFLSASK